MDNEQHRGGRSTFSAPAPVPAKKPRRAMRPRLEGQHLHRLRHYSAGPSREAQARSPSTEPVAKPSRAPHLPDSRRTSNPGRSMLRIADAYRRAQASDLRCRGSEGRLCTVYSFASSGTPLVVAIPPRSPIRTGQAIPRIDNHADTLHLATGYVRRIEYVLCRTRIPLHIATGYRWVSVQRSFQHNV